MSLINQMLKNLDKQTQRVPVSTVPGLRPVVDGLSRGWPWGKYLLLVVAIISVGFMFWQKLTTVVIKPDRVVIVRHVAKDRLLKMIRVRLLPIPILQTIQPNVLVHVALLPMPVLAAEPVVKKILQPFDPTEQAQRFYQQAQAALDNGDDSGAVFALKKSLQAFPTYHRARERLVQLYLQQQQWRAAYYSLAAGLHVEPHYLPFVKLQAHVLLKQGNAPGALQLLRSLKPPIAQHFDYYELLADVQRQVGKPLAAAQTYHQLLSQQPSNSVWWMGLGVSLEAAGKRKAALAAYTQAQRNGGLNAALIDFVAARIHFLED